MSNTVSCPLCGNRIYSIYYNGNEGLFYMCDRCGLIHKDRNQHPSKAEEKKRYLTHNNDVNDSRYQDFVSPIVDSVLNDFPKASLAKGLDFGAGTGPVITKMLSEQGYSVQLYDPFFHPNQDVLQQSYDFIVCCETMEHFHHPDDEFLLLKKLIKPNGKLYCMTELFKETTDFKNWYYKNDETHVVFYTEKTLEWIQKTMGFSTIEIDGRLLVFSR